MLSDNDVSDRAKSSICQESTTEMILPLGNKILDGLPTARCGSE